jgi:hypothetical protein
MRVVGSGKVADVLGVQVFAPKPGEGAAALGFRVTPCPASCGAWQPTQWLELQRRCSDADNERQRSEQSGQGQTSPQGRGWSVPGRVRERRARPSAVRAALTPLRPKLARANTSAPSSLRTSANSVGCEEELDDSAMMLRSSKPEWLVQRRHAERESAPHQQAARMGSDGGTQKDRSTGRWLYPEQAGRGLDR